MRRTEIGNWKSQSRMDGKGQKLDLRPLVSICLPTLNARRFLEPRINSILTQTLPSWELIVCDSYSEDGTWEYLQQFADDSRIRLYQVPKEGLYAGWNECLKRCCGEYIYIATADDTCKPELLEKMVGGLENAETLKTETLKSDAEDEYLSLAETQRSQRPIYNETPITTNEEPRTINQEQITGGLPPLPPDIAVCNFDYIDENGDVIAPPLPPAGAFYGDDRYRAHRRSGYLEFLVHLLIGTSWTTMTAVLFRRSLLEKTGMFVTDAGPCADRFWAYRSAVHSDTIVVPDRLATWRQHPEQGSGALSLQQRRKLWRKTVQLVDSYIALLPADWRRNPSLREKLLWAERRHYYDLYRLSRTALRYRPGLFLSGLIKALCLEPAYVVKKLVTGLESSPDAGRLESVYLEGLLTELELSK